MTAVSVSGAKLSAAVLVLSAIGVAIVWSVAGQMTTVCPAIYLAPPDCLVDVRRPVAGVVTVLISMLALGMLAAAAFRRFHLDAWWISMLGVLLGVAVAVGPLVVILQAGFVVDATLLIVIVVSAAAGIAIVAFTRQRSKDPERTDLPSPAEGPPP